MVKSQKNQHSQWKGKRGNASIHLWIENPLYQSPQMTLCLEVTRNCWPLYWVQGQDLAANREWICAEMKWGTCVHATTMEGRVHGQTLTSVDDHPMTLTSTLPINQTHPLSLFHPIQHALAWGHGVTVPTTLFLRLCGWHAASWYSGRSPQNWLWIKKRKGKTVTAIPRGKHHFSSDQWS